jgi:hypothetical protein
MNRKTGWGASALLAFALLQIPHIATAQSEGVKVHGDWNIDIRQPDGTLVAHHEFKNALASAAPATLAEMLFGLRAAGSWQLVLTRASGQGPCSSGNGACVIGADSELTSAGVELTKSFPVYTDGNIGQVETHLITCTVLPCTNSTPGRVIREFTIKVLPTPIPVIAGQIVQVTVVISFQ